MKSNVLWTLVGLNAVLLLLFAGQFTNLRPAHGQLRRPSDYLLIPGRMVTGPTSTVYVIDTTNGKLAGVAYDDSSQTLQIMPAVDLNQIYNQKR